MSKERTIRGVVTELMLAKINLVRDKNKYAKSTDINMELPIRIQPDNLPQSDKTNSQLPLPTRILSTQSTDLPSPPPGLDQPDRWVEDPTPSHTAHQGRFDSYANLRVYTAVNDQISMPRRVTGTLSHWKVGSDPSSYDWQRTVRALLEEEPQSEDSQAQKHGRKKQRKLQNHLDGDASRASASSSVPVVRSWGDQPPEGSLIPRLKSSQITEDHILLTQIERGVFGGREVGKSVTSREGRKKRAAGF
jgi:RNA polymerase I-specific transcription initiation factor RRN6